MTQKAEIIFLSLVICGLLLLAFVLQHGLQQKNADLAAINNEINQQKEENLRLDVRNKMLLADIVELKNGNDLIEEQARFDLGLIKSGEILYILP